MKVRSIFVIGCLAVALIYGDSLAKPPPRRPKIGIFKAYPQRFPIPYGHGLRMEYHIDLKLSDAPWRKTESVTTQYSSDGRKCYTDESARSPNDQWDNIHGDVTCGPAMQNLRSGHT